MNAQPKSVRRLSKRWLGLAPVLLGLAVVVFAATSRQSPRPSAPGEHARSLSVFELERAPVSPRVVGYGEAQPARRWRAIAEVGGQIVDVHPELDSGSRVEGGERLVRIDRIDYQLTVDRFEAEAAALEAQIRELERTRANHEQMLEIESDSLRLAAKERDRIERLLAREAAAPNERDQVERDYLTQKRRVQELENELRLLPARLDQLEANLRATRQRVAAAQRDLERTVIEAPFAGRLSSVGIELGQFVAAGEMLLELHDSERSEVEVRLPLDDLALLAPAEQSPGLRDRRSLADVLEGTLATVRLRGGNRAWEWPARLVRLRERIDPNGRTAGVIVRVDEPDRQNGVDRPPLLEGAFCEVEFSGPPRSGLWLVPRSAVRQDFLFVVDSENRLRKKTVDTRLRLENALAVAGPLDEGDRVVISNPIPAVEGTLVAPVPTEYEFQRPGQNRAESQGRMASGAEELTR